MVVVIVDFRLVVVVVYFEGSFVRFPLHITVFMILV